MAMLLNKDLTEIEKRDLRLQIAEKYNWLKIAEQTIEVYRKARRARHNYPQITQIFTD